jgi:hypothetical protein
MLASLEAMTLRTAMAAAARLTLPVLPDDLIVRYVLVMSRWNALVFGKPFSSGGNRFPVMFVRRDK